eukprot:1145595-Pelagomonas_calceolata.AAC.2
MRCKGACERLFVLITFTQAEGSPPQIVCAGDIMRCKGACERLVMLAGDEHPDERWGCASMCACVHTSVASMMEFNYIDWAAAKLSKSKLHNFSLLKRNAAFFALEHAWKPAKGQKSV